jgi:hypothetical protein
VGKLFFLLSGKQRRSVNLFKITLQGGVHDIYSFIQPGKKHNRVPESPPDSPTQQLMLTHEGLIVQNAVLRLILSRFLT